MFSEGWRAWYDSLKKPSWTPSPRTISLIWTLLYPLILFTLAVILYWSLTGATGWLTLLPFAVNLLFNLLFTPILFRLRNLPLATLDILLVWITTLWMMITLYPLSLPLLLLQLPYLAWVTAATGLQLLLTSMNRQPP